METEIYRYYEILKNKSNIFKKLADEVKEEFFNQDERETVRTRKVDGCKFLHTVSFNDIRDRKTWKISVTGERELTEPEKYFIKKILYMGNTGHTSFTDVINMMIRIVKKGVKGVFNGRGCFTYGDPMEEYEDFHLDGENKQQYMRRMYVGHFHFGNCAFTLSEKNVESIKKVLEKNNLL